MEESSGVHVVAADVEAIADVNCAVIVGLAIVVVRRQDGSSVFGHTDSGSIWDSPPSVLHVFFDIAIIAAICTCKIWVNKAN